MLSNLLVLSAAVLLNGGTVKAQNSASPCASVSSMSAAWVSKFPEATVALVPAQEAEDCLRSVSIDQEEDEALLEEMQYYLDWQSNLAFLKNPPDGYNEKRLDVMGTVKNIEDDLKNGKYEDEFTLQFDLSMALTKSYDFHFAWTPDITQIMTFRRGNIGRGLEDDFAVVSVSSDGKELPVLYNYYDIMVSGEEGWTPSPITEINNKTAEDFIQEWSDQFVFHEDHARYNRIFPNQALNSMGQTTNQFGRSVIPNGDYTTVKHKNGTELEYLNSAILSLDAFDDVEDGDSLFARFCNLGPPQTSSKKRSTDLARYQPNPTKNKRGAAYRDELLRKREEATKVKRQNSEPTATGYPAAETLHSEAVIGGYYLSGNGYDDVAVLSIPSFQPNTDEGVPEFQDLVGGFLKGASSAGKKKLVIDLRGNGGGRLFLGYDLFKQLFPSMDPYGASRFRANEAFDLVGQLMTEALKDYNYDDAVKDFNQNGLDGQLATAWKSIFNYRLPLNVENENFTSWEDYFGPHEFNGDKFTTPARWDLLNFFSDDLNMDITGYRTRANDLDKTQHFEADNIVLLQDGGCGSTCAVFSEFAKFQGGIQQVVVGGKPEKGPMQGVAGSKGSQVYTFSHVQNEAATAFDNLAKDQEKLNSTDLGKTAFAHRPLMRTAYQGSGLAASVINLRDNIRMNDTDEIPLEFVYEAADCRLFYTADMIRDPTVLWKKAVDGRWGDAEKACVDGSTKDKTSLSGGAATANTNGDGKGKGKKSAGVKMGVSGSAITFVAAAVAMMAML